LPDEELLDFDAVLPWQEWLALIFPAYVSAPFAQRHIDFWSWVDSISKGVRPLPFIAIWPRSGAKSTSAELACVRVGALRSRKYIWYCCSVQDQADKHVETIASMLESRAMEAHHPALSERRVGKYGHSRGWRRQRLRTRSGLTIDAIGLDVATRGAKSEEQRPDMIIFDDVDNKHDSPKLVKKKIETITESILPAGSSDLAVLFVQNLIHRNSIATNLASKERKFLTDCILSGPHPAVTRLTYQLIDGQYKIIDGQATWEGQGLPVCQEQINTWGISAFLCEAQHEVAEVLGGIYDHIEFARCTREEVPDIVAGSVWVDPAVTSTDGSCSQGIQADGISRDKKLYRFFSMEQIMSPEKALMIAITKALEYGFETVGVETDQGGDVWLPAYRDVCRQLINNPDYPGITRETRLPSFKQAKAGEGHGSKVARTQRMLVDYEHGKIVHVLGTHDILERALKRFPNEPLDLADVAYWGWWWLTQKRGWVQGMGA